MADRPFKSFFEARDALDAEILAGKLELSGPQNAVLRFLLEHALYKPEEDHDKGFVIESVLGVEVIAKLTGLGERTVKRAIVALEDMHLIRRFVRPVMSGGRKSNRICVNWMLPEGAAVAPSEGARESLSYGAAVAPSYGAALAPSIYRKQEIYEEPTQELCVVTRQHQDQTHEESSAREEVLPLFREGYLPRRVRRAPWAHRSIPQAFYGPTVWQHDSGWAFVAGPDNRDTGNPPGPSGWRLGYIRDAEWKASQSIELRAANTTKEGN